MVRTIRPSSWVCPGSKAGTFACTVYRRRGTDGGAWVTYTEEQAHYEPARWVQRRIEGTGQPVALRASSMLMHLEAIRAGTGCGVLPCYVGDGHLLLERVTPLIPEIAAEYWIIVHRDLRRSSGRTGRPWRRPNALAGWRRIGARRSAGSVGGSASLGFSLAETSTPPCRRATNFVNIVSALPAAATAFRTRHSERRRPLSAGSLFCHGVCAEQ
jgi:hypothetical protein